MDPPPTLQTLKLDCLLEILKYVPLPICISLRSTCSQLKTAVDEHFRTGIKALPVMLSSHYSLIYTAKFNHYSRYETGYLISNMRISSGVFERGFRDKSNVFLVREEHFLPEDYLILFNPAKFGEFVAFITKYLPNVTKLALLIDNNDYLNNIPTLLNLYRKQLKVLKLEKTFRSGMNFNDNFVEDNSSIIVPERKFELSNEFYDSLNNLEVLEALYFFTRARETLRLGDTPRNEYGEYVADPESPGHQCIDRLARRLKVLHITCDDDNKYQCFRFKPEAYDSLEELACLCSQIVQRTNASFPRLERLFFACPGNSFQELSEVMPNLRYISSHDLVLTPWGIADLNSIPNLERICCRYVVSYRISDDEEQFPGFNRTVQYIEVNRLYEEKYGFNLDELKYCTKFFPNLKKVILWEPYTELTAADLQGAN